MKILVTGAAGFIGFFVAKKLLEKGHTVVGLDSINDYYDITLKYDRLKQLGIDRKKAEKFNVFVESSLFPNFSFVRMHLEDREALPGVFETVKFDVVCNLAAQAGVRYSLENPEAYVDSNVIGFLNILENCRHHGIDHLVYASSSSVYGANAKTPFATSDRTDHPISLYAATKKSNELMAYTYSHLYGFPSTGLRFFTVYGPWGRPDMAIYLFTEAIAANRPIKVFNHGKMERDFTYIDDIVEGIVRIVTTPLAESRHRVYNIGNSKSEKLTDFIEEIEKNLGKTAVKNMMPIQPGDVEKTWADVADLENDYEYRPQTTIQAGIKEFVQWYKSYNNI